MPQSNNNNKPKLERTQKGGKIVPSSQVDNLNTLPFDILQQIALLNGIGTFKTLSLVNKRSNHAMQGLTSKPIFWKTEAERLGMTLPGEINQASFKKAYKNLLKAREVEELIADIKQQLDLITLENFWHFQFIGPIQILAKYKRQDILDEIYLKLEAEYLKLPVHFTAIDTAAIVFNQSKKVSGLIISGNEHYKGLSYLCYAIRFGHNPLALKFINSHHATINYTTSNHSPHPLLVACQCGNKEMVEILISGKGIPEKANINDVFQKLNTEELQQKELHALEAAVENGHTNIVKYLLESYQNNTAQINNDPKLSTPMDKIILSSLKIAVRTSQIEMVKLLIPHCELQLEPKTLKSLLSAANDPVIQYFLLVLKIKRLISEPKASLFGPSKQEVANAAQLLLSALAERKNIQELTKSCSKGPLEKIFNKLCKLNLKEIWKELDKHPNNLAFLNLHGKQAGEPAETNANVLTPSQR